MTTTPSPRQQPATFQPLNIVHVVDSLEVGGLERVTTDLAKAQKAAGHQVSVFSINTTTGLKAELLDAGITVVEGHKKTSLDRQVLGVLRQWIKRNQIDVVHAHNFVPNYHAAFATLGLSKRPVQICTCHDMGMRLSNRKLRWLFKWSLTRTAEVAMVGKQVYDRYLAMGLVSTDRANAVLNGIPVDKFAASPEQRTQARIALGLSPNDLVIGCVGRLVPLKNHHRMIDIMPALLEQHPGLKLVIVGDGERHQALAEQIRRLALEQNVILAGQRSNVSTLLPAFDIFALPSQTEGVSIALLEACATGLPVVATRVGGNPEIIEDQVTGLLIPTDDNVALESSLRQLIDSPQTRQELGMRAAQWVRAHASDQALRTAYDACYARALNRGQALR